MHHRTLGLTLLATLATLVALPAVPAGGQEDCPSGKPAIVSGAVPRALGKSPIWMTAESLPIKWKGPGDPVQLVWLMDAAAREPFYVSGKHRASGAPVKFTKIGDRVGLRESRWRLDPVGFKPPQAKPQDLAKYGFDRNYAWFPSAGCYEIRGQARGQETIIVVLVTDK